jgi:hypothetical protein
MSSSGAVTVGSASQSGAISADGTLAFSTLSGNVTLQTAGTITLGSAVTTAGNLTLNAGSAVNGTGLLTVGAAGAGSLAVASVGGLGLTNAGNLANAVSLTNTGSGAASFSDSRSMTLTASSPGNVTVTNASGTLSSSGAVTSTGGNVSLTTAGLMTLNHDVTAAAATGTVTLNSAGLTVASAAAATVRGDGGVTVDAGTGTLALGSPGFVGTITNNASSGSVSLTADAMAIDTTAGKGGVVTGGTGTISILPSTQNRTLAINDNQGSSLSLDKDELLRFSSTSTLYIGSGTGTGAVYVGNLGNGSIDLTGTTYNLVFRASSGAMTFRFANAAETLRLASGKNLTMNRGTGTIVHAGSATNDVTLTLATLYLTNSGAVGLGTAWPVSIPNLGASTLSGALYLTDSANLAVSGAVGTGANALSIATTGAASLAVNAGLTSSSGGVSLTAGSGGFTLADATTVAAGAGDILVDGGGGAVQLGTGALRTTSATATAVRIVHATTVALGNIDNGSSAAVPGTLTLGVGAADITGTITQTAATAVKAAILTGSTGSTVALTNANTTPVLSAFSSGSGSAAGAFALTSTGALTVSGGTVQTANTANSGSLTLTAGGLLTVSSPVSTNSSTVSSDITLNAAGGFALGASVTAAVAGTGTVTLANGAWAGGIVQTAGILMANKLLVTGTGFDADLALAQGNKVGTLAANVDGTAAFTRLTFNDTAAALTVGTVGATDGVTTNGRNLALSTTTSGMITVAKDIATGAGWVRISPASLGVAQTTGKITTTGGLELLGAGSPASPFTLTNAGNGIAKIAAGTSGSPVTLFSTGAVVVGSVGTPTDGVTTAGQDFTLTAAGAVSQNQLVDTGAGTLTVRTLGDAGAAIALATVANKAAAVTLKALRLDGTTAASGAVSYQSFAGFDIRGITTASNLALTAAGNVTESTLPILVGGLTTVTAGTNAVDLQTNGSSNDFATVYVASSGTFKSTDSNGYGLYGTASGDLDAATAAGTLTIPSGQVLATTGTATQNLHPAENLQVNGQATTVGGQVTLNPGTTTYLNHAGTAVSGSGTGALQFSAPVTLQVNTAVATANAAITFAGTIDGATANTQTLSLAAGGASGIVTVNGATGAATALSSLTVTGAGASLAGIGTLSAAGVGGAISVTTTGTDGITYTGTVYRTTGSQVWNAGAANTLLSDSGAAATFTTAAATVAFTGKLDMGTKHLTVDSTNSGGSPAGANVTFNQGIDNGGTLTVNAGTGGTAYLNDLVGSSVMMAGNLSVTGKSVQLKGIGTGAATGSGVAGTVGVTAQGAGTGTIVLSGTTYHSTGAQSWTSGTGAAGNAITLSGGWRDGNPF